MASTVNSGPPTVTATGQAQAPAPAQPTTAADRARDLTNQALGPPSKDLAIDLSASRTIEMNRDFKRERDGGKDLEGAMGATIFRNLQESGYIDANAKLADRPPNKGNVDGTSYEARLRQLITDKDHNGKLDIDLDQLRGSGLLKGDVTNEQLEKALSGTQKRLSDDFIKRQDDKSQLSYHGFSQKRGTDFQDYSDGMSLTNGRDRQTEALLAKAGDIAGKSPQEARTLAASALEDAKQLNGAGDQKNAQRLLSGVGKSLQDAGRLDEAAAVYKQLQEPPYATAKLNLVQDVVDSTLGRGNHTEIPRGKVLKLGTAEDGNSSSIDPSDFNTTYGDLAGKGLAQIDQTRRMQAALGRPVDPRNVDDARDYFNSFAKGKPAEQVKDEYGAYLKNFYVHSGEGVEWDKNVPQADRPNRLNELFGNQRRDSAGRTIVDCEGFSYLTDHVMSGVKDDKGNPRFKVEYAENDRHIITGVFENTARKGHAAEGFTVNNSDATMVDPRLMTTGEGRRLAMAKDLEGRNTQVDVVGFGSTQTEADVKDSQGRWHSGPGQYLYRDGKMVPLPSDIADKLNQQPHL